jgi:hypothetical protein
MIVDMLGAPGAGKTTTVPTVIEELNRLGQPMREITEVARPEAARTGLGRIVTRLPDRLESAALWRIHLMRRWLYGYWTLFTTPHLLWLVARTQVMRPKRADTRRRRVVFWFVRTLGTVAMFSRAGSTGVLFDEGLTHRTVQLFTSAVEAPSPAMIDRYLDEIPLPDVVVHIVCPVDVCRQRVHSRGVWDRWSHRSADEIDAYVANAHTAVTMTADGLRRRGVRVVELDNGGDRPVDLADSLVNVFGTARNDP